MRSAEQSYL